MVLILYGHAVGTASSHGLNNPSLPANIDHLSTQLRTKPGACREGPLNPAPCIKERGERVLQQALKRWKSSKGSTRLYIPRKWLGSKWNDISVYSIIHSPR